MTSRESGGAVRGATLVEVLRARAEAQGDEVIFRFLVSGEVDGDIETWTYRELDWRARAIAAALQAEGRAGDRALLLYPPGLDFIAAFLGCLYAGVVAVPTYPPDPTRMDRTLPRLRAIARDARAQFVLTTGVIAGMAAAFQAQAPEFEAIRWLATDAPTEAAASAWRPPAISSGTLAFLQYTSGSTGDPKGVLVTHGNVLANERLIHEGFGTDASSSGLGWLPLFHDMGLIGNVLQPIWMGFPCTLMSPLAFLERPLRWLRAVSHFRATTSGGPNFAYDLCVRRIGPREREGLDLGAWSVAFNGAEPVRPETLDRFADAFAPCGFRREAFYPCYGLAEGTLIVSGGQKLEPAPRRVVDGNALERGRAEAAPPGQAGARTLVSSGRGGERVVIVHPERREAAAPGEVGEIWVRGPSVAGGYWGRPEASERTFGARLAGSGEGPFLRTGDLGFLAEGELYVAGRKKDLIILRGRNLYPQDLERTVERAHPSVRAGCCAAFAVEAEGEERLGVAAEVDARGGALQVPEIVEAIRRAVAEDHGAHAHVVALLPPRTIPKTSSGKIQRQACRAGLAAGTLAAIARDDAAGPGEGAAPAGPAAGALLGALRAAPAAVQEAVVVEIVRGEIGRITRQDPARIAAESPLMALGLDSLAGLELQAGLEDALGLTLPAALLWQHETVEALARALARALRDGSGAKGAPRLEQGAEGAAGEGEGEGEAELSSHQLRLWFLGQLAPESAAYHVVFGVRMAGPLDAGALERSLEALPRRHAALRTVFRERGGEVRQVILPEARIALDRARLDAPAGPERERALRGLAQEIARRPFALDAGPLARACLVELGPLGPEERVLVVAQHHLVTDGWSIDLLVRDLAAVYGELTGGKAAPPPPPGSYAGYARWERAQRARLDAERAFWKERLAGLPRLALGEGRARSPRAPHQGAAARFALPGAVGAQLEALARAEGGTLFVALLSAYAALLQRYTGQEDLGIGVVAANRDRPEHRKLIGFFANTLVLRVDLSGRPSFRELLRRVRRATAEALAHAALPFDEIVRAAGGQRDGEGDPLVQASFVFERVGAPAAVAPGARWEPVLWAPDGAVEGTAKFELGLSFAEVGGELVGALEHRLDRLAPDEVERMAGHLGVLLRAAAEDPDRPADELPLLSPEEERRLRAGWSGAAAPLPEGACFPHLFAAQAARAPEAVAVICGEERLTYAALHDRACRLARRLRALGVGPERVVALLMPRGVDLLVAILAVFQAGGAYLPLDPAHPARRSAEVLRRAGAPPVMVGREIAAALAAEVQAEAAPARPALWRFEELCASAPPGPSAAAPCAPGSLAYVIYTSGSTGAPKGAMIEHRGMLNHLLAKVGTLELHAGDSIAQTASACFDISVWQMLVALLVGGRCHILPDEIATHPARLLEAVDASGITVLEVVPSLLGGALEALPGPADARPRLRALRWLMLTGEALPPALVRRWLAAYPSIPVVNAYGPTECSDDVTQHVLREPPGPEVVHTPIGRALQNTHLYVLDRRRQPAPIGVPGELYVGGAGVGRGYLNDAERTSEAFSPDPFAGSPEARMYRTGDVVRRLPDGALVFLGRVDHQVKIRGFRIELGEIEAALLRHPGVREAVVLARQDGAGDPRLVAYVAAGGAGAPLASALREHLRRDLPAYMVPSAFVLLDALPLNANGKVDRKALPPPDPAQAPREVAPTPPRTPVEQVVAEVWRAVLALPEVGAHDDFFALGGHSLLAMQVASRLRAVLRVEVPVRALFEAPTVAGLATRLEQAIKEGGDAPAPPLLPGPRKGELPLSFAQQRLWFLEQLQPGSAAYNVPAALRLRGALDLGALARVLGEVVRRHEVLRTTFGDRDGQPFQRVHAPPAAWPLPVEDLAALPEAEREPELARRAAEEAARPFDLAEGPMLRTRLLRLGPEDHALLVTAHHIASDGWSLGVLVREVSALYAAFCRGEPSPLPELPVQYADFAAWQRGWCTGAALSAQVEPWRERLGGAPPLELPTDHPRPAVQTFRGSIHRFTLPAELATALRERSQQLGATLFMTLLAAFHALLHRYSGQDELCVGTPIAGRGRAEIEPLIGFFVNTVVVRAKVQDNPTFAELLAQVRDAALEAYALQDVPFEALVEALGVERDLSRNPLFQVMFALQNAPAPALALPGLAAEVLPVDSGQAKFDLTLALTEQADGLAAELEYNRDLFEPATIARMAGHYEQILRAIAANPGMRVGELPLLTHAERAQILVDWNATTTQPPPAACLHELFAAQAARTPDALAVAHGEQSLSYRALHDRAEALARRLRALGVGPEVRVGLFTRRSLDMVVGLWGILMAGGVYVPLDPAYPDERIRFLLGDAAAPVILTERALRERLPETPARVLELGSLAPGEPALGQAEHRAARPDNAAYLIYTSGSTGRPKAVVIEHRQAVALAWWARATFAPEEMERVLASTSICFDLSVFELLVPMCWGGAVVVAENALELPSLPRAGEVTLLNTVPSAMAALLAAGGIPPSVRTVNLAGEPLREALARQVRALGHVRRLLNLYGPSETTTYSTWAEVPADGPPLIGRPVDHTQLYVLDAYGQPVPVGVPGELYIGGAGVARGYLERPELTAERFVRSSLPEACGATLYRTGDRVRWLPLGQLDYLGRLDHQLKIRGFRVEPGEIEAAFAAHPGVREALVVAREHGPNDRRLVAYFIADRQPPPDPAALRAHLRERLPEPLLPSAFVALEAWPLNANGKIDRRALPAPEAAPDAGAAARPATPTEEVLAGLWAEVLGRDRVGAGDDFFLLGGHSLLAVQVIARVRQRLGVELPVRALFEAPTLAALAARVDDARAAASTQALPPLVAIPRDGELPLSFAQQRLWFLEQLQPGSAAYNVPTALRLRGALDVGALARVFGEVVRRHEVLRTTFGDREGQPFQRVHAPPATWPLPVEDLAALPEAEREAVLACRAAEEAARPFDLAEGPLLRTRLLRLGPEDHALLVTAHHIASDGWSLGVLVREVSALYAAFCRGEPSPLPELPVQYADFAAWQRGWCTGAALSAQVEPWRERLAGAPPLELPTDHPRPAVQTFRGSIHRFTLPAELATALRQLSQQQGATLFMTVLAAFHALLHRYSGQDELCVGTPIAGRGRAEIEPLIGFFVNTVVVRAKVQDNPSFAELLAQVREAALEAYAHQDVPFEALVEALGVERDLSRNPLFQVMFALQNAPAPALALPGLAAEVLPVDSGQAKFDLTLALTEQADGLAAELEYNRDLFEPATIARMAGHYEQILRAIAANPGMRVGELPLLTHAERAQILVDWNATTTQPPPAACLHELFAAQAARTPDALAVMHGEQALTYRALDDRAEALARRLRALGVGPEVRVGLFTRRSLDMVVALWGILMAGGVYVPLDPAYPEERIRLLVEDAAAPVILTERALRERLPAGSARVLDLDAPGVGEPPPEGAAHPAARPEDAAYLIYTSGSTGRPKAVVIEHRQAVALAWWARATFAPEEMERVLASTSICFDLSVFELLVPMCWGGAVVVAENALELPSLPRAGEITLLNTVPSAMAALLAAGGIPTSVRTVNLAGEPLREALARQIHALGHVRRLLNLYGPSETTTYSTWAEVPPEGPPAIGRPVDHTQLYVLDAYLQPVPIGVPGELYIGGAGVARGYLERPELTAERFVTCQLPEAKGARLYRTGDRVRWLPRGELDYLGRVDHQVKIRGFRIEPGEIEAALAGHPGVREALVIAREHAPGDRRLVAYFIAERQPAPDAAALRGYLRERLPEPLLPSAFVALEVWPLNANGKIDRRALPAPEAAPDAGAAARPATPTEEILAGFWAEVLGRDGIGADDDFFLLGGHSLLAIQVIARVRQRLGVELPVRALFEAPTLAALAARVDDARAAASTQALPPLVAIPRDGEIPLSFAQQRLWFLEQLQPGTPLYNLPLGARVRGSLDAAALERSLLQLARRHEALRTTLPASDGRPRQVIAPEPSIRLEIVDLAALPASEREAEARRIAAEEALRPFDLARGPLLRATLVRLGAEDQVLLLVAHHAVCDGWSIAVLLRELSALYAGAVAGALPALPELAVQYADFAVWQRARAGALRHQLEHWRRRLAGLAPLELPTDRPRSAVQSHRGATEPVRLPPDLTAALRDLARGEAVTLFMVLLAGFQALLHRYTGQDRVAVGSPVAGRTHVETEGLIGFFVSTLVLCADLSGDPSFTELLRRAREVTLDAHEHQGVPFEQIVEALQPERDLGRTPLFQVAFALQSAPAAPRDLGGLPLTPFPIEAPVAKFDLTLALEESGDAIVGTLEYNADLFDRATIQRLVGHYRTLLAGAAASPERAIGALPLLTADERRQLLVTWNETAAPYSRGACAHHLVAAQAARTPDAVAVRWGEQRLTYRELDRRANQLARHLRARGAAPGALVGVCVERSPDAVVALLGTLKAGAAYVPLDPSYPRERLAFMAEDARLSLIVTQERLAGVLPARAAELVLLDAEGGAIRAEPTDDPGIEAAPDSVAYVIYTSGSTGRPKGVLVEHRGLVSLAETQARLLDLRPGARVLQFARLGFDASLWEIFVTLVAGGTLCVAPAEALLPGPELVGLLRDEEINLALLAPSALAALPDDPLPALRALYVGGEPCPPELPRRWAHGRRFVNAYGPTEATVIATQAECRADSGRPPIGQPIANAFACVLDARLQPVPIGVPGELYVGGVGVARGYLERPELTAARFIESPLPEAPGARLYRTGDRARWLPGGALEFLGRLDDQLKLRGFRIEPGEIEATLAEHPAVREAIVIAREQAAGDPRLVAFVLPRERPPAPEELRQHLRGRLPDYMIPAAFAPVDAWPLTPSGKVDRRALAAIEPEARAAAEVVAPRSRLELELRDIWEEVLGVQPVGVTDDFFALGGHSLLAVRLVAEIRRRLGRELPLASLFQGPTVERLAAWMRRDPAAAPPPSCVVPLHEGGARAPFFCVHPVGGNVLCYAELARALGPERPVIGLQSPDLEGLPRPFVDLTEMASAYLDEIRRVQPEGPYRLGGWSMGGVVAFEMARQLERRGEGVALLALLDAHLPPARAPGDAPPLLARFAMDLGGLDGRADAAELEGLAGADPAAQAAWLHARATQLGLLPAGTTLSELRVLVQVFERNLAAFERYTPGPVAAPIALFRPEAPPGGDLGERWARWTRGGVRERAVPGDHYTMLRRPAVDALAEQLRACLDEAEPRAGAADRVHQPTERMKSG